MSAQKRTGFGKSALFMAVASATLLTACSDSENSNTEGGTDPGDGTELSGVLTINAAYSLMPTGLKQLVTVTQSDGTVVNADEVKWTLKDGSDINASNSDPFTWSAAEGVLMADDGSGASGSFTLTASAGGESASFPVEVVNARLSGNLEIISPEESVMPVGFTAQYRAVVTFTDGNTSIGSFDVTEVSDWSSTDTSILLPDPNIKGLMKAAVESTDSVTAKASYSATVGAEYAQYNSMSGVGSPITTELVTSVEGVDVAPLDTNDSYIVGQEVQLVAKLGYNGGVDVASSSWDVTHEASWSSTAPDLVAVDEAGTVSPLDTIDTPVDITATLEVDSHGKKEGFLKIDSADVVETTTPPTIALTTLDGSNAVKLFSGHSTTLKATASFDAETSLNVTDDIVWSSSDTKVAVVNNATGEVSAVADGTASISAVYQPDPELVIDPIEVSVSTLDLNDLTITELSEAPVQSDVVEVVRGEVVYLKASGTPLVGGSEQNVTSLVKWTEDVADSSVTITTYSKGAVEVAVGESANIGSFKVTASSEAAGKTDNITVNVVEKPPEYVLEELTISEAGAANPPVEPIKVVAGGTVNFRADGAVQGGGTHDITKLATWSETSDHASITSHSADGGILTVDDNAPLGTFTVDAQAQGVSATNPVQIDVVQASGILDMSDLEISHEVATTAVGDIQIEQGESIQLKAAGTLFSGGTQEDVTGLVKWHADSNMQSPATISSYGDDGGLLTVRHNAQAGDTFTVTAEAVKAGETSNVLTFVVTEKPGVLGLSELNIFAGISMPQSLPVQIEQGESINLTAIGTLLSDGTPEDVTNKVKWDFVLPSADATLSSYGEDGGQLTVKSNAAVDSTFKVVAKGQKTGVTSNEITFVVTEKPQVPVLSDLNIFANDSQLPKSQSVQIEQGQSISLTATGILLGGDTPEDVTSLVKWDFVEPVEYAAVSSYGEDGGQLAVKHNAVVGSTFTIHAKAAKAGETSNELTFVVTENQGVLDLSDLNITADSSQQLQSEPTEVKPGESITLTATGTLMKGGTSEDVSHLVKWGFVEPIEYAAVSSYGEDGGQLTVHSDAAAGESFTVVAEAQRAGATSNELTFVVADKQQHVLDMKDLTIAASPDNPPVGETVEVVPGGTVSFEAMATVVEGGMQQDVTNVVRWDATSDGETPFTITSFTKNAGILFVRDAAEVGKVITISAEASKAGQASNNTLTVTVVAPATSK